MDELKEPHSDLLHRDCIAVCVQLTMRAHREATLLLRRPRGSIRRGRSIWRQLILKHHIQRSQLLVNIYELRGGSHGLFWLSLHAALSFLSSSLLDMPFPVSSPVILGSDYLSFTVRALGIDPCSNYPQSPEYTFPHSPQDPWNLIMRGWICGLTSSSGCSGF